MAPLTAAAYRSKFAALDVDSDGFWSVDLRDGRYIWLLADNLSPRNTPFPTSDFKSNAYVIQDGDTFTMTRAPAPFNQGGISWNYWPLAGWASDNILHVILHRHPGGPIVFDGLSIQSYYLPSMELAESRDHVPSPVIPRVEGETTYWDKGLWDDGTDIWIYGMNDKGSGVADNEFHVARCARNNVADTFEWEYEGKIPHTSSAASLGPYDSGKIIARGPLENTERWTASDPTFADIQVDDIEHLTPNLPPTGIAFPWAYAAHCHPHLPTLTSGKMLVTVNVNDGPGVWTRYFPDFYEITP